MPTEDFQSARAYLESLIPKEREDYEKIGLGRIRALLDLMGNPQDSYPTIHVGGTAGKGSTATMIASIMQTAGYKTGLHVSPHLQDIRERMQVNGKLPSKKTFVELVAGVKKCVEQLSGSANGRPSYFEALLAMTFENFRREKVDVAVVEVGMGGRLDGTNVISPKLVVLTNIGLDHMEFLGDSLESIAVEKAGIFKTGVDIVTGVTQPQVMEVVEKRAGELGCKVDRLWEDMRYDRLRLSKNGSAFDLSIRGKRYNDIRLALVGEHQVGNATLAIDAALKMNDHGFLVKEDAVRQALARLILPCRFEVVALDPVVILDGAHNPMKIDALVETLTGYCSGKKVAFIFAAKKDKNVGEMVGKLSAIASRFYFTSFSSTTDFGKRMAYDPSALSGLTNVDSKTIEPSVDAYRKALLEAGPGDIICVTGSLYLSGELRSVILG